MQITLTKITRLTKDKEGNPLTTKDGRNYTRLLINCNEKADTPLSGFDSDSTKNWQVGDTVEVAIEEKEYNGKTYLNFKVPKQSDKQTEYLNKIWLSIQELHQKIDTMRTNIPSTPEEIEYPEEDLGEPPF